MHSWCKSKKQLGVIIWQSCINSTFHLESGDALWQGKKKASSNMVQEMAWCLFDQVIVQSNIISWLG